MKICKDSKCKQLNPQPFENFFKDKALKDGHANRCKICKNAKTAQWREDNREKYNADMRKYNKQHYGRLRLQRYNLMPEQYLDLLREQDNKCAICAKAPKSPRPLNIDHDHETGKTRGLLCHGCNRLMVLLDNVPLYQKALEYKTKYA